MGENYVIWVKIKLRVIIELIIVIMSIVRFTYRRETYSSQFCNPTNSTVNVCIAHNLAFGLLHFTWKLIEYSTVAKSPCRNIKRI